MKLWKGSEDIYDVNFIRHHLKRGIDSFSQNNPFGLVGIDQVELEAAAPQHIGDEVAGIVGSGEITTTLMVLRAVRASLRALSSRSMGKKNE